MMDCVLGVMDCVVLVGYSMIMLVRDSMIMLVRHTTSMVLNGELILNFSILHIVIVHG